MAEHDLDPLLVIEHLAGTGPSDAEREEEEIKQLEQIRQLNEKVEKK